MNARLVLIQTPTLGWDVRRLRDAPRRPAWDPRAGTCRRRRVRDRFRRGSSRKGAASMTARATSRPPPVP